ncbi:MAG: helix-turn-helix domain-containing protein [Candidatus Methanoperedens sp.]|nr:helix-turn-helix domain-containing protein [Candidatus Methanoperedens sp.]
MPENEKYQGDEKLLILPLGEESKKITQVISNDTARQIIELLADVALSANDIAQRLQVPLTTITYNLENLESVGLIKVEKIKYSEKGREVKIYAPVRKLIILVPEKTDRNSVADILRKYLGMILTAFFASSLIEFFVRKPGNNAELMQTTSDLYSLPQSIQAAPDIFTNIADTITAHPGLVFFMGCLFVIALFIIMDFLRKRKNG